MNGVIILDGKGSIDKFSAQAGKGTTFESGTSVTITRLFDAIDLAESEQLLNIKSESVQVFVSPVDEKSDARGTYVANTKNWKYGHVTFSGIGMVNITISDYFYCNPFTITVEITPANLIKNGSFGGVDIFNYWERYSGLNPFAGISLTAYDSTYAGTFERRNAGNAGIRQLMDFKEKVQEGKLNKDLFEEDSVRHSYKLKEAQTFKVSVWTYSEKPTERRVNLIAIVENGTVLPEGTVIYENNKYVTLDAPREYNEGRAQVTLVLNAPGKKSGWQEHEIIASVPKGTFMLLVNAYIPMHNDVPETPEVVCVDNASCYIKTDETGEGDQRENVWSEENLFNDPQFEEVVLKTDGWKDMSNAEICLEEADQRNGILKLTDKSTSGGAQATYNVEVKENTTYFLSLKYKADMDNNYNPSVHIREYFGSDAAASDVIKQLDKEGEWIEFSCTFTTSAGCTALDIIPYISVNAQGTVYFDDFFLTSVSGEQNQE